MQLENNNTISPIKKNSKRNHINKNKYNTRFETKVEISIENDNKI